MAVDHLADHQNIVRALLRAAQNLPAADLLPARTGRGTIRSDLLWLELSLDYEDFEFERMKPLIQSALVEPTGDALI